MLLQSRDSQDHALGGPFNVLSDMARIAGRSLPEMAPISILEAECVPDPPPPYTPSPTIMPHSAPSRSRAPTRWVR